jgi:hypothetical protein
MPYERVSYEWGSDINAAPIRIIMITEIIITVIIFMRHEAAALAGSSSGPGSDWPGPADVPTTAGVRSRY